MTEMLIQPGVTGLGLFGTTGEGHSLLWDEKLACARVITEVSDGRVQLFAGVTALGTREVIRQIRGLQAEGIDGALVGLPLWQTPTVENSVQFFADLSAAVPDMPVMVYSNSWFFKSTFPPAFWSGLVERAPTVIASKNTHGFTHFLAELEAVDGRINLMPGDPGIFKAWELIGADITAVWSTQAALGPEPVVALMAAIRANDSSLVDQIIADFRRVPPYVPPGRWPTTTISTRSPNTTHRSPSGVSTCPESSRQDRHVRRTPISPRSGNARSNSRSRRSSHSATSTRHRRAPSHPRARPRRLRMPIRTGKEFLEGLRDDREVWLDGERVADVTTHPMLAGFAAELADIYDLQHDPDLQDLLTMTSPTSGERVSFGYIVPTSLDDLQRRRRG